MGALLQRQFPALHVERVDFPRGADGGLAAQFEGDERLGVALTDDFANDPIEFEHGLRVAGHDVARQLFMPVSSGCTGNW